MLNSIGQHSEAATCLEEPTKTLKLGKLQKSMLSIMALVRSKPTKADQKTKKCNSLKDEMQQLRKQGYKEEEVLPKSIHDAAIKAIASNS